MAHSILAEIDAFLKANDMPETTFGRKALGDWRFIKELRGSEERAPRRLWPETERKVRHFMATYRREPQDKAA